MSALRTAALAALGAAVHASKGSRVVALVERALEQLVGRELNTVVKAEGARLLSELQAGGMDT